MKNTLISLFLCMTCVLTLAGCQSAPAEQAGTEQAADTAAAAAEAPAETAGQENAGVSLTAEQAQAGETAESSSAATEAAAPVPAWTDMTIVFDDLTVALPMSYSDLSGSWAIEDSEDAPAELAPGERREDVRLVREGQEDVYVYIDLLNEGDTAAPPEDCTVYGFSAEITWLEEDDDVPSLTLSDGVTWGSRLEDLKAAYGSPTAEHRSEEQEYTSYTYAWNYTEVLLTFTVFDEKGLTAVSMVRTP